VILERFESTDQGTFGRITFGEVQYYSGELPWRDNETDISCIPVGIYNCKWTYSNRFKRFMYLIRDDKRTGLRFHSANLMGDKQKGFMSQLNGCIALGEKLGTIDKQKAILISQPAIRKFETLMNKLPFELEIKNA
jgi:hypothetical protein